MMIRLRQLLKPFMAAGLAWFLAFPAGSARAQAGQEAAASFEPDPAQIERAVTIILLCDWAIAEQPDSPEKAELWAVLEYFEAQKQKQRLQGGRPLSNEEIGNLAGSFDALGVHFDRVSMLAGAEGIMGSGWSAAANPDQLVATLHRLGHEFQPGGKSKGGPDDSVFSERITPEKTTRIFIAPGRHTLQGKAEAEGVTLLCRQEQTTK